MIVGSNLKDNRLQQVVDKTMLVDKNEDEKISFAEFSLAVGNTGVLKKMVEI